ncbi:hypothetical protein ACQ4LE_004105 [Meloidogyne hapla]
MQTCRCLTTNGNGESIVGNGKMMETKELTKSRDSSFARCTRHLTNKMKLLVSVGLFLTVALCILEAIWFRRAICVMIVPLGVVVVSSIAIFTHKPSFLWPIIGISFFHLFLDVYATIVFLFFFIYKPLYIIMVLNWAFDNMYPNLSPYYPHCGVIFAILIIFFLFNFWQLRVSLCFKAYLDEILLSGISAGGSTGGSSCDSNNSSVIPLCATSAGSESILQQPQCRNISKSPSALPSDDEKRIDAHSRLPSPAFNSNIDARKIAVLWHSPSPSIRRGVILPQCARTPPMSISGGRRPSLGDTSRQFSTR